MKITVISIVVGTLGNFHKKLEKDLETRGRIETVQNTIMVGSPRIFRSVQKN